jgi:hypothetical protein
MTSQPGSVTRRRNRLLVSCNGCEEVRDGGKALEWAFRHARNTGHSLRLGILYKTQPKDRVTEPAPSSRMSFRDGVDDGRNER